MTTPEPKICKTDAECPDKMGCCMFVNPDFLNSEALKANGFLGT